MTTTIPVQFVCRSANGAGALAMRNKIYTGGALFGGVRDLVTNSTYTYSSANRRILMQYGSFGHFNDLAVGRDGIQTTNASFETIFEQRADLSKDTDQIALVARGENIELEVTIWALDNKTSSIFVWQHGVGGAALQAGAEATLLAGPTSAGGDESITIEVKAKYNSASPGTLYMLEVYEVELVTADLP